MGPAEDVLEEALYDTIHLRGVGTSNNITVILFTLSYQFLSENRASDRTVSGFSPCLSSAQNYLLIS